MLPNIRFPYSATGKALSPETPDLPTAAESTYASSGRSAEQSREENFIGHLPTSLTTPDQLHVVKHVSSEEDEPPPLLSVSSDGSDDNIPLQPTSYTSSQVSEQEESFRDCDHQQTTSPPPPSSGKTNPRNTTHDEGVHELQPSSATPGDSLKPTKPSPTITKKSLPHTAVKQESYCFQAPPKRRKTTKSGRGARRLRFVDTDSLLLEEAIQRNQLLRQAQRLFTDLQL